MKPRPVVRNRVGSLLLLIPALIFAVACSGAGSRGDGSGGREASGGDGGREGEGSDDLAGNRGDTSNKTGGTSGKATDGGSGGTAKNNGGAPGAMGGEGGTGGSGEDGASAAGGGSASGGVPGQRKPPSLGNVGVLFSGKDELLAKLHAEDGSPGYFHGVLDPLHKGDTVSLVPMPVPADDPALPEGTKFAMLYDGPVNPNVPYNNVTGFNFREDSDGNWQFLDVSGYKAISFYAKVDLPAALWNLGVIDSVNVPTAKGGDCPGTGRADCPRILGKSLIVNNTWKRFVLPFEELTDDLRVEPLETTRVARVDFIQSNFSPAAAKLWITAVKLEKELKP